MKTKNHRADGACISLAVLALGVCGCGTPTANTAGQEGQGPAVKTVAYDVSPLLTYLRLYLDHDADRQDWMGDLDLSRYDPNAAGEALVHILERELGKDACTANPVGKATLLGGRLLVRQTDEDHYRLLAFLERAGQTVCTMIQIRSRYLVVPSKIVDDLKTRWHQGNVGDWDGRPERSNPPRHQGTMAVADDVTQRPLRMTWALIEDAPACSFIERAMGDATAVASANPRVMLCPGQHASFGTLQLPFFAALRASFAEGNTIRLCARMETDEIHKTAPPAGYSVLLDDSQPASRPPSRSYVASVWAAVPTGKTLALRLPDPVWTRWQTAENGLELIVLFKPEIVRRDLQDLAVGTRAPRLMLPPPPSGRGPRS